MRKPGNRFVSVCAAAAVALVAGAASAQTEVFVSRTRAPLAEEVRLNKLDARGSRTPEVVRRPETRVDWLHTNAAPALGNGRVWVPSVIRGSSSQGELATWDASERSRYGTIQNPYDRVVVTMDLTVVPLDPYTPIESDGLEHFEEARIAALRDRGLVGGVRRFVSPNAIFGPAPEEAAPEATTRRGPVMKLRLPPEAPRTRSRESVMARPVVTPPAGVEIASR